MNIRISARTPHLCQMKTPIDHNARWYSFRGIHMTRVNGYFVSRVFHLGVLLWCSALRLCLPCITRRNTLIPPLLCAHYALHSGDEISSSRMFRESQANHLPRCGITSFDTSPYYGDSEIVLGSLLKALAGQYPRSSYQLVRRHISSLAKSLIYSRLDIQMWKIWSQSTGLRLFPRDHSKESYKDP